MTQTPENQQQYGSILTVLGENAEQNGKLQNKQISFTHIAIGDANDTYVQPDRTQTALVNELARIQVNSVDVLQPTPDSVPMLKVEAILPDDVNDLVIREFAAVAEFNGQSYFHAIGNCARIYVPPPVNNGNVLTPVTLEMIFVITSAEPIIEIDPNVVTASREWVKKELEPIMNWDVIGNEVGLKPGTEVSGDVVANFINMCAGKGKHGRFTESGTITINSDVELEVIGELDIDWSGVKLKFKSDGLAFKLSSKQYDESLLKDSFIGENTIKVSNVLEKDLVYIEDTTTIETQWNQRTRELFMATTVDSDGIITVDRALLFDHKTNEYAKCWVFRPIKLKFHNFDLAHYNSGINRDYQDIASVSTGTSQSYIKGFYRPEFSGEFKIQGGMSFSVIACYQTTFDKVEGRRMQYPISPTAASYDTVVKEIDGRFVRHPVAPSGWFNRCRISKVTGFNNFSTIDAHPGFDCVYEDVYAEEECDMYTLRCLGGGIKRATIKAGLANTPHQDPQIGIVTLSDNKYASQSDWVFDDIDFDYFNMTQEVFATPWQGRNLYVNNVDCHGKSVRVYDTSKLITGDIEVKYLIGTPHFINNCSNFRIHGKGQCDAISKEVHLYKNHAPSGGGTILFNGILESVENGKVDRGNYSFFDDSGFALYRAYELTLNCVLMFNHGADLKQIRKKYIISHKIGGTSEIDFAGPFDEFVLNVGGDDQLNLIIYQVSQTGLTQTPDLNEHCFTLDLEVDTRITNNSKLVLSYELRALL